MFKFDENSYGGSFLEKNEKVQEIFDLALNTSNEEEMFELLKFKDPFVNRKLAQNTNLTEPVMMEMLSKYIAHTMCMYIANNPNVTEIVKARLYEISENEYKDSIMKEPLDEIFKKAGNNG